MPKENIHFPKKRKKKAAANPEEIFRNTLEKGLSAIRAFGKGNARKATSPQT